MFCDSHGTIDYCPFCLSEEQALIDAERKANIKHRTKIENDIFSVIHDKSAVEIFEMLKSGFIPHVSINY